MLDLCVLKCAVCCWQPCLCLGCGASLAAPGIRAGDLPLGWGLSSPSCLPGAPRSEAGEGKQGRKCQNQHRDARVQTHGGVRTVRSPGTFRHTEVRVTEEAVAPRDAECVEFVSILALSSGILQPTRPIPPTTGSPLGFSLNEAMVPRIRPPTFPMKTFHHICHFRSLSCLLAKE